MRKIAPFLLLDVWRGFAALWVVMDHACAPFLGRGDNRRFIHDPLYEFSALGQLGVVIFFVISGYCIMGAAYGALAAGRIPARYALDRIWRIYPPYLTAFFISIAMGCLLALGARVHLIPHVNQHAPGQGPLFYFSNFCLVQTPLGQPSLLVVAWSLCYEICFYLLLGILLVIARAFSRQAGDSRGVAVLQIGISGLTLGSLFWLLFSPDTCPFPLDRWYQFGLGALLFLLFAIEPNFQTRFPRAQLILPGILGIIGLFPALYLLNGTFVQGFPDSRMQATTCLIFIAVLAGLRPWDGTLARRIVLRPFMWLGTFSYSLYLTHILILPFFDVGGRSLGLDHDWYLVTYFVQIAASLPAGWFFYWLVERHFISMRQKQRIEEELRFKGKFAFR